MATSPPSSSSLSATTSSSPSLYPSSCSSIHSVPLLSTNLSASSWSPSYHPASHARDQLENLIARHGRPTRFSLSSLQELTATSSTYNPPSPFSRPRSPVFEIPDYFETRTTYRPASRPIPIPKRSPSLPEEDIPVTPLTGRFERDYFPHRDLSPERIHESQTRRQGTRRNRRSSYNSSRMRSDSSSFLSPVASPSMPSPGRSDSPQPPRSRAQNTSKSAPAFHLGSLPRFHPAVYQSSNNPTTLTNQPSSPRQSRQHLYRTGSASRDTMLQYRELVEGVSLQKAPSRPLSPSPAAPRLDPLRSPGPVTPLALEEAGGYLATGASNPSERSSRELHHSAPAPDLLERLIARENERIRQKARKNTKGW